jgi:hypothetical protein
LRWPIRINSTPNQNEILNTGRRLLAQNQVQLRKGLSYLPKEMQVVAYIQPTAPELLERARAEFQQVTKLAITFIS